MPNNYFGSICLSDIPKELIITGKNGKKYLNVVVNERRTPGQYGHTHYIKVYAKKEAVPEGANLYIGELKPSEYGERQQQAATRQAPPPPSPPTDDLPF